MPGQRPTPPPPPPRPPRPAPHPVDPRRPRALAAIAAGLAVISTAVIVAPFAIKVWTSEFVPAANRVSYGELLVPALAAAGLGLYLIVSVLLTPRRTYVLDAARGEQRSEDPAAGVASPGHTPAAATRLPRGHGGAGTHHAHAVRER